VAGDTLYGAAQWPLPRFFLHARSVAFTSPSGRGPITVEAALPDELEAVLKELCKDGSL
jgi:23S rRNA-/tRNA-specific pseudouridylate synthase